MISTHTFVSVSFSDFEAKFKHALNTIEFKPTLAFAFISVEFSFPPLVDMFREQQIVLFGSSTGGEILFDAGMEYIGDKSAVVVLTDIPSTSFQLYLMNRGKLSSFELGQAMGDKIAASFKHPSAIIGSSGILTDGQALVEGVLSKTKNDFVMFGGLAGDDALFEKTFVFTDRTISDNGGLVLVFDQDKIELSGMTSSGWISLGAEFTVNRSKGNTVFEINDLPALDMYMNYLNVKEDDLPGIGIEYPFMVKKGDGSSVLRAVTGIDKERRSLIFAGTVSQGSTVSFSTSPGFEIMENTREKIISYHNKNQKADLMLLFSCIARHIALGPLISTEIKLASIKWRKPLVGFFTYGEVGNNENGNCSFYNQTFTLALISEKRK
jgi:hypothetical protein